MWGFKSSRAAPRRLAGIVPNGDWVRLLDPEQLVGRGLLCAEIEAFAKAADRARGRGSEVGLRLEVVTGAEGAASGLRVYGAVDGGGVTDKVVRCWQLGDLPSGAARLVLSEAVEAGVPVAAELVVLDASQPEAPRIDVAVLAPSVHAARANPQRQAPNLTLVR
jgi:hypothetical protein